MRNNTKSVALYSAEQGLQIRSNAILPAVVLTPMWEPMLGDGPEPIKNMADSVDRAASIPVAGDVVCWPWFPVWVLENSVGISSNAPYSLPG